MQINLSMFNLKVKYCTTKKIQVNNWLNKYTKFYYYILCVIDHLFNSCMIYTLCMICSFVPNLFKVALDKSVC